MTGVDMKRLSTRERKIYRNVHGPVVEQGMLQIGTNQKLREIYNNIEIAADMEKKILEYAGHEATSCEQRTLLAARRSTTQAAFQV
jgi:hypothetical protein